MCLILCRGWVERGWVDMWIECVTMDGRTTFFVNRE